MISISINIICNGGIHRDGKYTVEYSQWLNVHGKLSDREHSEIKNSIMFSMSTVLKPITCTQLLNLFYVYIYVPFLWAILDQIQYSLDFCHVTSFHGNKGSLNSLKKILWFYTTYSMQNSICYNFDGWTAPR